MFACPTDACVRYWIPTNSNSIFLQSTAQFQLGCSQLLKFCLRQSLIFSSIASASSRPTDNLHKFGLIPASAKKFEALLALSESIVSQIDIRTTNTKLRSQSLGF